MKKWIFTLALTAMMGILAAQPLFAREFTGGVKFGFGMANAFGDDTGGTSVKPAFSAGAFFRWSPNRVFTFQPEFQYIRKGASYSEGPVSVDTTLSYIEFPFLIRLSIPTKRVQPNLIFGDYLAFKVGANASGEGMSMDISDSIATVDAGLVLGAGLDIEVGKSLVMVEYRAEIGALDVPDNTGDGSTNVHNIAHMFLIGYAL